MGATSTSQFIYFLYLIKAISYEAYISTFQARLYDHLLRDNP